MEALYLQRPCQGQILAMTGDQKVKPNLDRSRTAKIFEDGVVHFLLLTEWEISWIMFFLLS